MTIDEVQSAAKVLSNDITTAVQLFEQETGCIVHSLPVLPAEGSTPTSVRVKVQIPE
jgi:hypothetical protein